ncbi:MAG: YidC/Oxa1 family membrane protein insertase [Flavobacteriales bacterium]|nr:YidC/Oxa1 family membrane protein insertase [Flavobacteriales bacterium]
MDLYRKAGVNPASGCLPMLVQMPIPCTRCSASSRPASNCGRNPSSGRMT